MKKNLLFSIFLAGGTLFSAKAQTWNIPVSTSPSSTYIGTKATGGTDDFNIGAGANTIMQVKESGEVSIGYTTPGKLTVLAGSNNTVGYFTGTNTSFTSIQIENTSGSGYGWSIGVAGTNNSVYQEGSFYIGFSLAGMVINSNGNIGIGIATPSSKLHVNGLTIIGPAPTSTELTEITTCSNPLEFFVNGNMGAREVKISVDDWCDYVFDPAYKLKPLKEVENYINAYKHLPEVPSEQQIKADGVKVGEMMKLYIKKIEELTLYMIELQKQNEKLAIQNDKMAIDIAVLKK